MLLFKTFHLHYLSMPLKHPFKTANDTIETKPTLILESIHPHHRIFSECVALPYPGYNPETLQIAANTLSSLVLPQCVNKSFTHPSDVKPFLDTLLPKAPLAKACIEMAYWALAAEQHNQSLAHYIGGIHTSIPIGVSIGIKPTINTLIETVLQKQQEGYQRIKIKITPNTTLKQLMQLQNTTQTPKTISLDANGSFNTSHLNQLKTIDSLNFMMIEQPYPKDAWHKHATLQTQINTPICLDESIDNLASAQQMITQKSGQIITLKPGCVGGFNESIQIHHLCKTHRIPLWCGGMLETGIGRAYNVALASLPQMTLPHDISPSAHYWDTDICNPEWVMTPHGTIEVPLNKPGIGVIINEQQLQKTTIKTELIS